MAAKKAAKLTTEVRIGNSETFIEDLYEHQGAHCEELEEHTTRIKNLEEDLTGRDKVIWAILDQHNARLAALKSDEAIPEGEVILANGYEETAAFWSWFIGGLVIFGLAAAAVYYFPFYRGYLGL